MKIKFQWFLLEIDTLSINLVTLLSTQKKWVFSISGQSQFAIDLGTANTLIIHNDKVVVDSPSIVAIDHKSGKIIAVGHEAKLMHGKTHENIKTIRPLKDGVIADFNASEQMIGQLIKSIPNLDKRFYSKESDNKSQLKE